MDGIDKDLLARLGDPGIWDPLGGHLLFLLCRFRTSAFSIGLALRFWGTDLWWPNRTLLPGE